MFPSIDMINQLRLDTKRSRSDTEMKRGSMYSGDSSSKMYLSVIFRVPLAERGGPKKDQSKFNANLSRYYLEH